ncbi:MAG: radical SAM protein [Clostridiales bacterium]|nr:radical SAM protein [Clostridiales bacterium]
MPALSDHAHQELLDKARLQVHGVKISDEALNVIGAGTIVKEGPVRQDGKPRPASLILPNGLNLPLISPVPDTPYALDLVDQKLVITENGKHKYKDLVFEKRPLFYSGHTSDGTPMQGIVSIVSEGCAGTGSAPGCVLQAKGEGCLFCNFYTRSKTSRSKSARHIAETVKAAFDEGAAWRVNFNGGILGGRREIDFYIEDLHAIFETLGRTDLLSSVCLAAPTDLSQIDRLKDAGFTDIAMNLEIWDKNIFKSVCPGKERLTGYDAWVKALEHGAKVFGKGHVCTNFVTGIEPMKTTLEGIEQLASVGVLSFPAVFQPTPGTPFEGHRCPTPEWNLDLHERTTDILIRHGFKLEHAINTHAVTNTLFQDVWRVVDGLLPYFERLKMTG